MYDARTNLGNEVVEEVRKYFREKFTKRSFQEIFVYQKHLVMENRSSTTIHVLEELKSTKHWQRKW